MAGMVITRTDLTAEELRATSFQATVDTAMMSRHLAEISTQVAPGAHAILVLDGAGYHGTAQTRRPRGQSLGPLV